jgi:prolyl oligopeptidase
VILDPNRLSERGAVAMSFFSPSPDGKYVAAVLSRDESEEGSAHIFEVATGKELADVIPRVLYPTAGGSIAWKSDGSGFWHTRYPQGKRTVAGGSRFLSTGLLPQTRHRSEVGHLRHRQGFSPHR